MKNWTMVVVVALAAGLVGCQSPGTRPCTMRHREHFAAKATAAKVIEIVSLDLRNDYPTDQILRLPDVVGPDRTWRILVGPNAIGEQVTIKYTNTDTNGAPEPDVEVTNGWVYVVVQFNTTPVPGSRWGRARTQRVTATAEGTHFIVQQQDDLHRVILLSGTPDKPDKVHVELGDPPLDAKSLTGARKYFEVTTLATSLPSTDDVPGTSKPFGQLVAYIESVANVAGVN